MKINTKQVLKNFEGRDLETEDKKPVTLGLALSTIVLAAKEGGKMKMFVLAEKIYKQDEVEVDAADLTLLKRTVETTEVYANILVPGQILMILETPEVKA